MRHVPRGVRRSAAAIGTLCTLLVLPLSADDSPHVRLVDRALVRPFETGLTRSPTLRRLVAAVEAAPVLVFVQCNPSLSSGIGARLQLVTTVQTVRYVRIEINCSLPDRRQVALLAHELQHAVEISARPDVTDSDSMESYYEDIGFQTRNDGRHLWYETATAIATEAQVADELVRGSGRKRSNDVRPSAPPGPAR